ncbi:helix-turn-helix domain-containing protein [Halobacteriales archaeon Cl-PHB]
MKSLRLHVHHTAETMDPMHAFCCQSPAIERYVVLRGGVHRGHETVLCYVEGDRDAFEEVMLSETDPDEFDVTPAGESGFFVYVHQELDDEGVDMLEALSQETVVPASPIEFHPDRTMRLTLVGHPDDLQAVVDDLPAGASADVVRIGDYAAAMDGGLTDRQRAAVEAAWEAGYYELPREGDIEAVADELDCAISTASDLLRRAERVLVADTIGRRS